MERFHPEAYPKLKDEIIQAVDPEWVGTTQGLKLKH
jgi:hypothetical protein